jgi:hypothetical protein
MLRVTPLLHVNCSCASVYLDWCHEKMPYLLVFCTHNVDVYCGAQDGDTAMIRASVNGCTNCVRLLVDAGADKNAKNRVRVPWLVTALLSNNGC